MVILKSMYSNKNEEIRVVLENIAFYERRGSLIAFNIYGVKTIYWEYSSESDAKKEMIRLDDIFENIS